VTGARPTIAPPLAGLSFCGEIPDLRGRIEPSDEASLAYGKVLDGRFVIREIVARSGMATIHRAEDLENGGREVAIKVPLARIESDPAGFARFCNEARVGLSLAHPALPMFLSVEGVRSRPYIAMEFLQGCTLDRLVHRCLPLPECDAFRIAAAAAEGLAAMHAQGIVHRDVKPANIMICRDRTLRLIDFGISAEPMRRRSLFGRLATPFGTPQYMAPEQVEQGLIDERADVYGLGAVLYELLTGVTPLHDEDPWRSAYRRTTGDPVAPRTLNPGLSPQAEEIVLRALRRRPGERYPGMDAFLADLRAPGSARVSGLAGRLRRPRWRPSLHASPILTGLVLGVGYVLAMAALFIVVRHHAGGR
jgi:serine/threonine protein kinase